MSLIRFSPRGLTPWFDDIDRWFDESVAPSRREPRLREWSPAVDIFEEDDKIVVRADLPDMKEEDLEVNVEDDTLTLRGERKFEHESKKDNFHRIERTYGSFSRSFTLPETVDAEKIAARYDKGVLEVTLPKKQEAPKKSRKVKVTS